VKDEAVGVRHREDLPELLQGPGGARVVGDIDVHQPATAYLHCHKDVQHAERRGHRHAEIAGDDGLCGIANERGPPLIRRPAPAPAGPSADVPADGTRRDAQPFRSSSAAIRSSPPVGLLRAIAAIRYRSSAGRRGRPRRERQRQRRRNASRCHRRSVAAWTIVSAARQANHWANRTSARRSGSEACRGFTCRSWYRANCAIVRADGQGTWDKAITPKAGDTLSWCVALATRA
jgi:hypothetical protein